MKAIDAKLILVNKINELILEYPGEGLKSVSIDMKDPNEIADIGVIARYVDEELYDLYTYFEHLVQYKDNYDCSNMIYAKHIIKISKQNGVKNV